MASLVLSGAAAAQNMTITVPDEVLQKPTTTEPVATPGLTITIPETVLETPGAKGALPDGLLLSDRMAEQIRTLIRIALATGDASAFEDALFDLTIEVPDFAAAIAAFTTSEISQQVSASSTPAAAQTTVDFVQTITVAATVGPATAVPAKFQEIVAATTEIITQMTAALPVASAAPSSAKGLPAPKVATALKPTVLALDINTVVEKIMGEVETGLIGLFNDDTVTSQDLAEIFTAAGPAQLAETPTTQSASPSG